jgi:hypothetical protein
VVVEEGILTPTQQYQEYQAWLELNQQLGGIIPPHEIAKRAPIQGKTELMQILEQQMQQQQAVQAEATNIEHAFNEAKLQEMHSRAIGNVASAKERYGRYEADLGLKDERESELTKNRALATKAKMEALEKMVDVTAKLGAVETMMKMGQIDQMQDKDIEKEDAETNKSQSEAVENEYISKLMSGIPGTNTLTPPEPTQKEQSA